MTPIIQLIIAVFSLVALWKAVVFFVRPYVSPLRSLPGPPSPSWFWGQVKYMLELDDDALIERWIERYGNNVTFTGLFNV